MSLVLLKALDAALLPIRAIVIVDGWFRDQSPRRIVRQWTA